MTKPPLPTDCITEIRNDSLNRNKLSDTGTAYFGSNWREIRKLYTADQVIKYAAHYHAEIEKNPCDTCANKGETYGMVCGECCHFYASRYEARAHGGKS